MAYAISFMMLAQLGGIAFGLAIGGAVFVNGAVANLMVVLPDATREQLQMAISGTSGDYLASLAPAVGAAATDAIVDSLCQVFILVYVAAALSLVLSVCFTVSLLAPSLPPSGSLLLDAGTLLTLFAFGSNGRFSRILSPWQGRGRSRAPAVCDVAYVCTGLGKISCL
jgi:hypothetical protein